MDKTNQPLSSNVTDNKPSGEKIDLVELLNQDDEANENNENELEEKVESKPVKEETDEDESDEKDEEKIDIKDEDDEDNDDEKDEDDDLTDDRFFTRRKDILKKYPNLFKEFPALERGYYHGQKVAEYFPTLRDAKEAKEQLESFNNYVTEINDGNIGNVLEFVKKENPEAFSKLVDNYLPTLFQTDEKAYYHIFSNITRMTIGNMVREAQTSGNEALKAAAVVLNQFVFGNTTYTPPSNLAKAEDADGKKEVQKEREKYIQERLNTAVEDLTDRVENILTSTIQSYIDPKQSMTDYVRRNAIKDCVDSVRSEVENDKVFRARLDKLWENATKNNFNRDSLDKIKSAYISKARTVLPDTIRRIRGEALRGLASTTRRTNKVEREIPENRGDSTANNSGTKVKGKPAGMSTLDYFNMD